MELAAIRSSNLSFSIPFNPTSRHTLIFTVTPNTGSLIPRRVRNSRFSLARNPTKESKKNIQDLLKCNGSSDYYHCPLCCRRHFLGAVLGTGLLPISSSSALDNESTFQDSMAALNRIHPPRPEWYEEFYASSMDKTMISYEAEVAEALPVNDASVDAVVGTLVLCSVKDVTLALQEVRRVLKPGGYYIFVEHVAAKDGTVLRFVQGVLDPLQQIVADGCHLTRNTGTYIARAGFTSLDINQASVSTLSIISPHVYGIARR
ncbi:methyltransferase-like protein 7A-like [Dorcoceras hygrometricum]|uniref:Methyltransferase-like protein 7A-like n=1 Tax=Dorcoceras hygrometricum TaxID=472368 RepID=A0A2Z7B658_9LAMI|nr:methyltransferase-like protein 7A-like [Dorcoceras hygrometricum]